MTPKDRMTSTSSDKRRRGLDVLPEIAPPEPEIIPPTTLDRLIDLATWTGHLLSRATRLAARGLRFAASLRRRARATRLV